MNYLEQLEHTKTLQGKDLEELITKIDKNIQKFTPSSLGQTILHAYRAISKKEKKIEK
jgi:hypothetical protein